MKVIKLNLKNIPQRQYYSRKLQEFEKEFDYSLGDRKFQLSHGDDYFLFFEGLGEVSYFVIIDKNYIVGALCAVLRNINGCKSWYLCDFKINKNYRGKKLYRRVMIKYFLSHYLKCRYFFCINMNEPKNNKLFTYTKKIFKILNVDIFPLYLYQFDRDTIPTLEGYSIVTNNGYKDIIIDNCVMPIYHLIKEDNCEYQKINIDNLPKNAQLMLLSQEHLDLPNKTEISFIGNQYLSINSAEI